MTDQPRSDRRTDPPGPTPAPARDPGADRQPLLPRASSDETDVGWGDLPDASGGDDERILREVPPHHLG